MKNSLADLFKRYQLEDIELDTRVKIVRPKGNHRLTNKDFRQRAIKRGYKYENER